ELIEEIHGCVSEAPLPSRTRVAAKRVTPLLYRDDTYPPTLIVNGGDACCSWPCGAVPSTFTSPREPSGAPPSAATSISPQARSGRGGGGAGGPARRQVARLQYDRAVVAAPAHRRHRELRPTAPVQCQRVRVRRQREWRNHGQRRGQRHRGVQAIVAASPADH